jgi:hypothetical protein
MATSYLEDKSKYRANQLAATWSGADLYDVDDKIGRADYVKVKVATEFATEYGGTVSGTEGAILV